MNLLHQNLFVKIFLSVIALFIILHAVIWIFYTSEVFDRNDEMYVGDLGRVSYQLDSLHPRKLEYTLEKRHLHKENWNFEQVDILTVGDSFSNADTGGLNPYYQDYLSTFYDKKVLNLQRFSEELNSMELLIALYNSGWLERYKPKYIILEAVERFALNAHAKEIDWDKTLQVEDDSIIANLKIKDSHIPSLTFINTANYKFIRYALQYKFSKNGYKRIPRLRLSHPFFSPKKYANYLLITQEDIKNKSAEDELRVTSLNKNLNKLADMLSKLDIKLFYMPAVDKYDLYYDFIIENPYQKNYFFDLLRNEEKNYSFIDTKAILLKALNNGEQDIFYADDTHWSYRASELIVKSSIFRNTIK